MTSPPHFVVLSSGLWHMLHITDADDFVHRTENLKKAALALTESQPPVGLPRLTFLVQGKGCRPCSGLRACPNKVMLTCQNGQVCPSLFAQAWRAPLLAMFSITEVYPPRLKTDEKRQHLTLALVDAYNEIIGDSGILAPAGPVFLIDVHRLTKGTQVGLCICHRKPASMPRPMATPHQVYFSTTLCQLLLHAYLGKCMACMTGQKHDDNLLLPACMSLCLCRLWTHLHLGRPALFKHDI